MTEAPADIDLEGAWSKLAETKTPGTHQIRLHPLLDLNATITNPDGVLGLFLRTREHVTFEDRELVGSEQISISCTPDGDGDLLVLVLEKDASREMFLQLCDDLVTRVVAHESERAAATTFVRRFNAWQQFLKRSRGSDLSREQQLGLYGELKTLQELLMPHLGTVKAVSSWTGPARTPQDFQWDGMAIEVKTVVHSEPQTFRIDGERQLDDFGLDALLLAHHRVFRHQGAGETLPEVIATIRAAIAAEEGPLDDFDDSLLATGYRDDDAGSYSSIGYSLKDTTYYRVQPGFPRLTEADLFPGIGSVVYTVTASACSRFEVETNSVLAWLRDPPKVQDPAEAEESLQVEYKQTAWTPTTEIHNAEHRKSMERELKTSIVKTVVAFLNSEGGELVIGVKDGDRSVTGIEVDLEFKGMDMSDLDHYEQELVALFSERIDRYVHNQVRIRFEPHDSGTACHVTVRPSPSPRFGYAALAQNERRRPIFWVRAGNTTQELEGPDLVAYLREHWS